MKKELSEKTNLLKRREEEIEEFKKRINSNLDMLSPFPKRRSSRFSIKNRSSFNVLPRTSILGSNHSKSDLFAEFDKKFEENAHQINKLQLRLEELEVMKANIEKENVVLKRDNSFLEKDISILRKEKDFYERMLKSTQNDNKRLKAGQENNIKLIEAKYKNIIHGLEKRQEELKTQLEHSRMTKNYNTKPNSSSYDSHNNVYKKKISVLERNLQRVMTEKKVLTEKNKELTSLKEKQGKIIEELQLERFGDISGSGRNVTLLQYDRERLRECDFSVGDISILKSKNLKDRSSQTDPMPEDEKLIKLEQSNKETEARNEQLTNENIRLMRKVEEVILREIDIQAKIETLTLDYNCQRKFIEENLRHIK